MNGLPQPPPLGARALPPGTFEDAVVVVTGGGTGLGKAIGVEFARLGATVAVASRDAAHRTAGVEAVEDAGGRGLGVACDVRDEVSVAAAFDAAERKDGVRALDQLPVRRPDLRRSCQVQAQQAEVGLVGRRRRGDLQHHRVTDRLRGTHSLGGAGAQQVA